MRLLSVVLATLFLAIPVGSASAGFDFLDETASGTRRASRMQNATSVADPPPAPTAPHLQEMLDLVNQQRAAHGLAPVRLDPQLNQAAQGHSAVQAAAGDIFHDAPDGSNPGTRITRTGYSFSTWGENVAAGYRTPQAVMAAWMNSSGHCRNILNPAFTELGVGYVKREGDPSRYYDYWTQVFSRPSGEASPPGTYNASWC